MSLIREDVVAAYGRRYGERPEWVVRAPGRVNLNGEHTDYNNGFVMPLAIDRAAWIALGPRDDRQVHLFAADYQEASFLDLDSLQRDESAGWVEYLKGVCWALRQRGMNLQGWQGISASDVPMGAGLSSSAAFELAVARACAVRSGLPWNGADMAMACQRAENEWVGVNCGIMDQMISACGRRDHALLIDCRDLSTSAVPIPAGTTVVALDTSSRRGLVDSAYNERRRQCEEAARFFGVDALRDISPEQFAEGGAGLDEVTRRRARHVISENERTVRAAEWMRRGDAAGLGRLMVESHASLRDDFEVTNHALNQMVECALAAPGCFGARMTGAGFGGCALALVDTAELGAFLENTAAGYKRLSGLAPKLYPCRAMDGASVSNQASG